MIKMITILVVTGCLLALSAPAARADQYSAASPPVSQTLVREGDIAVKLAQELQLSTSSDEAQAESALVAVGIEPNDGWIADYPVTPVVMGQLQQSVESAATSQKLSMSKSEAADALSRVAATEGLPIRTGGDYAQTTSSDQDRYENQTQVDSYYDTEGPPVVSYYSPPWDYAYLYDWVPYPFWYSSFFFPGFFILSDFDVVIHDHDFDRDHNFRHDRFDHDHDFRRDRNRDFRHDRDHDFRHVTNHRFDKNGHSFKVDPANLNKAKITNTRANSTGTRSARFNENNANSAKSIMNRDTQRFASVSHDRGGMNTGDRGMSHFNGNRVGSGTTNGSFERGNIGSNRSFSGNRSFEGNTGRSGFSGGSHMASSFGGGMTRGFSGGSSHFGGFSHSGGFGGGFGHGGGFGGGFGHGGGGFSGGHGGGGGRR